MPAKDSQKPPTATAAGSVSHATVGADQVSRLTATRLVAGVAMLTAVAIAFLWWADYWVWINVSPTTAFEAIAAESNAGLAAAAFFAIWSSGSESKNTREMLRQMQEQHMEMHRPSDASHDGRGP